MDFSSLTPLAGGWSGETFVAQAGGERTVVRVYGTRASRGPLGAEVDAALLRLVRGLLPVPEVLEQRPAQPVQDQPVQQDQPEQDQPEQERPALLVTSFLPGLRGDELLPTLDHTGLARLGGSLGDLVADLGGMPMLRPGPFVDGDLTIGSFGGPAGAADGLPGYVAAQEPELAHLSPQELAGLREVAVDSQALLDTVPRCCLVHSDLNPKNLLVDPATLELTGLVDWEFAHAGHPFTDLGNLLRFDRAPAYSQAVLERYCERRRTGVADALALARAADLWALVDLATRRHASPVAARADRLLRQIARRRDPGATEPA